MTTSMLYIYNSLRLKAGLSPIYAWSESDEALIAAINKLTLTPEEVCDEAEEETDFDSNYYIDDDSYISCLSDEPIAYLLEIYNSLRSNINLPPLADWQQSREALLDAINTIEVPEADAEYEASVSI